MKILFISRTTLYSAPGGDTIQIESTAEYLRKLGILVDIILNEKAIDYSKYDLLHFFNIIRPADIIKHIQASHKPFVISPIFVDYSEYEKKERKGIIGFIGKVISSDGLEYLKTIARMFKNGEKIGSLSYLVKGHRQSIIHLIKNASYLLPNSHSEYNRLFIKYGIKQKYKVIPNAIDTTRFINQPNIAEPVRTGVICVARLEGLKNQINLIRALNNTCIQLKIIGKPGPNNIAYAKQCRQIAASNIEFIDHLPQDQLVSIYQQAKVHILPSWFETTGLSSLEAAVMGCNIVVTTKGDTIEYFKNFAYYCDPSDILSIKNRVLEAYKAPSNQKFKNFILENYTWDKAAIRTLEVYKEVLKDTSSILKSSNQ